MQHPHSPHLSLLCPGSEGEDCGPGEECDIRIKKWGAAASEGDLWPRFGITVKSMWWRKAPPSRIKFKVLFWGNSPSTGWILGGTGAYPSYHRTRGGVHLRQITNLRASTDRKASLTLAFTPTAIYNHQSSNPSNGMCVGESCSARREPTQTQDRAPRSVRHVTCCMHAVNAHAQFPEESTDFKSMVVTS